ncbi:hypothetical protein DFH06DRAFT_1240756 [Mycena polygramma]|nr:hypothetical protein DFH06DRAFT_1240756 [Mycena polygramma]
MCTSPFPFIASRTVPLLLLLQLARAQLRLLIRPTIFFDTTITVSSTLVHTIRILYIHLYHPPVRPSVVRSCRR